MRQKLTILNTKRAAFLAALATTPTGPGAVPAAARRAGVHRATAYRWRATDPAFAREWEALGEALLAARLAARLAEQATRRAVVLERIRPACQERARRNFATWWARGRG